MSNRFAGSDKPTAVVILPSYHKTANNVNNRLWPAPSARHDL